MDMAKFSQQFLERVRLANPVEAVVGERVQLRKSGKTLKGLCPFHNEKTPSFHVTPDKGFFHCFGCHEGGNVFQFVMKFEGVSFAEAVEQLAQRAGIPFETDAADAIEIAAQRRESKQRLFAVCQAAQQFFETQLHTGDEGRAAREYLLQRGVADAAVRALRLGYAPDAWDALRTALTTQGFRDEELLATGLVIRSEERAANYDRFRARIMFPIWDLQGNVIAFGGRSLGAGDPKYLNSPETPIYTKSKILYPINLTKRAIQQKGLAVLCEGYMDALMLAQHRFTYVVASCGTALTDEQAHLLKRFAGKVIVAYDGDAAGQEATQRSISVLVEQGMDVFIASLQGGEDPDSFLRAHGPDAFRALLDEAQPFFPFLLQRLAARMDLRTPHGQRALCDELFPLLARFGSTMIRDGYLDELARFLGVQRERLGREFAEHVRGAPRERLRPAAPPVGPARPAPAELQLLALILREPHALAHARTQLDTQFIQHAQARALIEAAYTLQAHDQWHGVEAFLSLCTDEQTVLITDALSRVPDAGDLWREALDDCIKILHNTSYDTLIAGLQKELQSTSDPHRVQDLLTQIRQYQLQKQPTIRRLVFESTA
jgi:DNA primase